MKFWEAMKALEEGKKVRMKKWNEDDVYITQSSVTEIVDQDDSPWDFESTDAGEEWEIYEETEKTYTWMEVVQGFKEDRKFQRKDHQNVFYAKTQHGQICVCTPTDYTTLCDPAHLYIEHMEATDWIEVKP